MTTVVKHDQLASGDRGGLFSAVPHTANRSSRPQTMSVGQVIYARLVRRRGTDDGQPDTCNLLPGIYRHATEGFPQLFGSRFAAGVPLGRCP